jgi:pimeloyl-ACP methyl ester carboxylesterase
MGKVALGELELKYYLDDFTDPWVPSDTMLMHHGYCRNSKFWNAWVPSLARKYRVLRFDVRGCGESSVPQEGYVWSAEQLARDALGLVDALKIQKVHWIGESSGGVIGIVFASTYPERIKSLVICDTPTKFGNQLLSNYGGGLEDPAAGIDKLGFKEWCNQTMGLRIDKAKADQRLVNWYASEMAKTPQHVAKALFRVFGQGDVSSLLRKIKAPTLVLAGAKSPIAGPDQQRIIKENLANAQFEIFEGVGHGVHLLMPDRCTTAVLKFLQGIQ